jgi:hypothetical protein
MAKMMQHVDVKLNPGLKWQEQHSAEEDFFTSKLDRNLRKRLVKYYIWSVTFYGAETRTPLEVDQKYLKNSEMWC